MCIISPLKQSCFCVQGSLFKCALSSMLPAHFSLSNNNLCSRSAPCYVTSVMSDSVRPPRWQPTRLSRPWDSPGENTGVGCHFLLQFMKAKSVSEVAQSCPTLCDPMDCSLPGSSVPGIFQARVLEWSAIAFSRSVPCWLRKSRLLFSLFLPPSSSRPPPPQSNPS